MLVVHFQRRFIKLKRRKQGCESIESDVHIVGLRMRSRSFAERLNQTGHLVERAGT